MANFASLKATIDAQIKANGNQEITGPILNAVLTAMINTIGNGYALQGTVATTGDNPGSSDNPVAYLAAGPGTYTNFDGVTIPDDGHAYLLTWDTSWSVVQLPLATFNLVDDKVDKVAGYGLSKNDYTDADKAKLADLPDDTTLQAALDDKQDKDYDATPGNVAVMSIDGNSEDGGIALADLALNSAKQDKDIGANNGEAAVFDGSGNTIGSGILFSDLAMRDIGANMGDVAVMDANGYSVDSGTPLADLALQTAVDNKADKVGGASNGDLPELDADGNLSLSGLAVSDLMQKVPAATEDNLASFDNAGQVKDSGIASGNVAQQDGNYPSLISGAAKNLVGHGSVGAEYTFRTSGGSADIGTGAAQITKIKGKTIAWNQLVDADTTEVTIPSGRKYFAVINGTASVATSDGTPIAVTGGQDMVVDLTLMSIASEISTAADFEALYPGIYGYLASKLKNNDALAVVTTGFNQWDEEWEVGGYNYLNGQKDTDTSRIRSKNPIRVIPGNSYYIAGARFIWFEYSADGTFLRVGNGQEYLGPNEIFTPSADAHYIAFQLVTTYGTTYRNNICINLSWSGYRNGEYEPYWKSTLQLNLNALACHDQNNNAVTVTGLDGVGSVYDEGVVENGMLTKIIKRFAEVDLGDLTYDTLTFTNEEHGFRGYMPNDFKSGYVNAALVCSAYRCMSSYSGSDVDFGDKTLWKRGSSTGQIFIHDSAYASYTGNQFKTAMAGVKLRYELATPLTLTLDTPIPVSYRVDDFGTEERTSPVDADGAQSAPIVYDVQYAMNAVDTLRRLPKNYISKGSATNLLEALKTAGIISAYTMTYNSTTQEYEFTVTP